MKYKNLCLSTVLKVSAAYLNYSVSGAINFLTTQDHFPESETHYLLKKCFNPDQLYKYINKKRNLQNGVNKSQFIEYLAYFLEENNDSYESVSFTSALRELNFAMQATDQFDDSDKVLMNTKTTEFIVKSEALDIDEDDLWDEFFYIFRKFISYSLQVNNKNEDTGQSVIDTLNVSLVDQTTEDLYENFILNFSDILPADQEINDSIEDDLLHALPKKDIDINELYKKENNFSRVDQTAEDLYENFILNFSDILPADQEVNDSIEDALLHALPKKDMDINELYKKGNLVVELEPKIRIPYIEYFGSELNGICEYHYNENIRFEYNDFVSPCSTIVPDYKAKLLAEEDNSEAHGYGRESLPKLLVSSIKPFNSPRSGNPEELIIEFGVIDYFSHRIIRDWLLQFENHNLLEQGRELYLKNLQFYKNATDNRDLPWPMAGCGAWIVTSDNMLLMSRRTRVTEEVHKLGYSSAGSADRHVYVNDIPKIDANPFLIITQETIKEIGLKTNTINPRKFTLISLGLDLTRCLIQFSFFSRIEETAIEVLQRAKTEAMSGHEQDLFAVPFKADVIKYLIKNYEMESGAIFSLQRCIQKGFTS